MSSNTNPGANQSLNTHTGATPAPVPEHDDFITAEHPWPGLAAFTEQSHSFFHGRAQATGELVRLVSTSHAGVLFGQSGLGKTSLIQAGLFPVLRQDDHLPVYVRLDHSDAAPPLSAQILSAVTQECRRLNVDCPAPQADDTLWSYFHRQNADFWADGIRLLSPVLVLDQFEEIFTQGQQSASTQARAAAFVDDLAGLVENRAPKSIRQRISAEPASAREFDFARANFRLMLSLREDFLPELEGLMPQMPTLRLNRLRLLPMNGQEALQVVKGGGALVEPQASERIVRFVAADQKARPLGELAVEPSLLSLICRELNLRRQSEGLAHITTSLLTGARDEILGKFYQRCLDDQAPELGDFIEDHLLSESGYRNAMVLEDALRLPQITRAAIDTLIQRRLLRLEERSGLLRVELTHDVLTQVARERRSQRREAQAKALLQQQMEKSRKRMRRITALAVFMLVLVVGMAGLSWQMFRAREEAEASRTEASLALAEATRQKTIAEASRNEALTAKTEANQQRELADAQRVEALAAKDETALALKQALAAESRARQSQVVAQIQAKIALSRTLATQANEILKGDSVYPWSAGSLLALEANALAPDVATMGALIKARRLNEYQSVVLMTSGGITAVAFSPDGKTLAMGSWDNTVRLWDTAGRKPLGEPLRGHEDAVRSVAFSPDGKTLASR